MGHKCVCLTCQKAINLNMNAELREKQSHKCPDCQKLMVRFSHRFRPPKKNANKKWDVVRYLHTNGFDYEHLYEYGKPGYAKIPETMKGAVELIERLKVVYLKLKHQ